MNKSSLKSSLHLVSIFLLTLFSGTSAADDTEIYFNSPTSFGEPIRPNVLLILDTSGSMTTTVSGTGKSRMQVMKEAMVEIINRMEDVNVGLMRFTNDDGGPVMFPIRYIDEPAADTVSEPDDTNPTFTYVIGSGSDDAEEDTTTNDVTLSDPVLDISQFDTGTGTFSQRVNASLNDAYEFFDSMVRFDFLWAHDGGNLHTGARFSGVTIPLGASIISAFFRMTNSDFDGTSTTLSGHDVDNSPSFSSSDFDISTRIKTSANVTWNFTGANVEEQDVTPIIQEIVGRGGWSSGNSLTIISHDSVGTRRFESFDTSSAEAPELEVLYSTGGTTVDQLTGLRFSSVDIPQGATITNARLILTPTATQSGGTTPSWVVRGEDSDDAATFTNNSGDISGRDTTTTSVTWSTPDTTANVAVTSPDLTSVVQEIVNRGSWCGGNAMAFVIGSGSTSATRFFHSFEGNADLAPQLEISYDANNPGGCYRRTETAQIASDYDDVEEDNGTMQRTSGDLDLSDKKVGVRFTEIDIPQGATILDAVLEFNSNGSSTQGNPTIDIFGESADNSSQFTGASNDLSNRALTTASVSWNIGDFNSDAVWHSTPDIKTVVQEIINLGGWESGNALSFILDTGPQNRPAESHDDNPNQAPRISITYEAMAGGTAVKTVREKLIELVNGMPTSDWTPIVEVLYEAAHYWRGEEVVYGKSRDDSNVAELSHPGSYCEIDSGGNLDCSGADVATHPPYGVELENGCDPDTEWYTFDCDDSFIRGTPDYISPFNSTLTCQSNYQVLLTDGEANRNGIAGTIESEFLGGNSCQTTKSDGSAVTSGEECGIDLAQFMFENDQSDSLDNDQLVSTFTIGFDTSSLANATRFLTDVADAGDGQFFEAETASDLVSVFNVILADVKSDPTSFVSPSLATNAFNRLLSRDEVYFGLFTPSFEQSWSGNVKKYNICVDSSDNDGDGEPDCTLGQILDANDDAAIDEADDKFRETAQSEWSDVVDGRSTIKGGTGGETTDFTTRILYTDATSDGTAPAGGTSLDKAENPGFQIDINSWDDADLSHVRDVVCPTPDTTAGSDCEDRMLWMLGKSLEDENSDTSATTRWTVTDVLHSSPAVITYGGADNDDDGVIETFFDRLIVGTNEGGLRFINATTGKEEWMFLPQIFLEDQPSHFANAEGDHLYGLDVTPTLDVNDVDGDGFIEPADGDFVHALVGMRRGGNFIYAIDVTPADELTDNSTGITPKFLWRINSSTSGYSRLAQTWSPPRIATIATNNGNDIVDVMIFGGGYDASLDSGFGTAATGGSDNLGNAIYVADPSDGSLIMSISGSGSGADIEVADMHYSIPSRITIMDTDGDGLDDRLYVGDTGGQVWRVDLAADIDTGGSAEGNTVVGRLANISTPGTAADERRFFDPPAVVQVKDTIFSDAANGEYDYVLIGSGNRAHPLNTEVQDRFYAFRDKFVDGMPDTDGTPDNLADSSYPQSDGPISHTVADNLIDVTTDTLDSSDTTHVQAMGWYFDFESAGNDGEKVLSAATAIAGAVFFTTYSPGVDDGSDLCSANIGGGNAYNFNILTTKAAIDWDEDGTLEDLGDRKRALGGGIPSDVVPVFTKEGVVGIVGVEGGASQLGALSGLPRYRTYWYEE